MSGQDPGRHYIWWYEANRIPTTCGPPLLGAPLWDSLRRMDITGYELGGRDTCSDRCGTGVAGLPADVVALGNDDLDRARRWT